MLQALVMTIATQICTDVVARELDDYTIVFRFKRDDGAADFINELEQYSDRLSLVRIGLEVIVTFAED